MVFGERSRRFQSKGFTLVKDVNRLTLCVCGMMKSIGNDSAEQ